MRCWFNKLSMLVESFMLKDPFSGHLFVFFNKIGDKCKILKVLDDQIGCGIKRDLRLVEVKRISGG